MNKRTIITILLALVTVAGQGQIKCHVKGTLETDTWGDEIIICEAGTDLRVVDDTRFHVKAKDGRFTYDIETDFPRLYVAFFLKQYETSSLFEFVIRQERSQPVLVTPWVNRIKNANTRCSRIANPAEQMNKSG